MRRFVITIMCSSLLGGCAGGLPGLRPLSYQEPGDTRVYASYQACPHKAGENIAPVLASVAIETASQLIKGFGAALSKGAEGGALPTSVSNTNIEVGKDLPQCLVIIRGRFSPDGNHKNEVALPPIPAGTHPLQLMKRDGTIGEFDLPKVYDLQHYIEIQLLASQNKAAMTFGPALVYLARSMDGSRSGDRSLSIGVKFSRTGHDDLGGAVLIGNRKVGEMAAYPLDERNRMQYESPWFPIIEGANPDASGSGTGSASGVTEGNTQVPTAPVGTERSDTRQNSEMATAGKEEPSTATPISTSPAPVMATSANGPFPYTLTTTVIETRPTKEFLVFVASVFAGVEPTVTDKVKSEIDPAARLAMTGTAIDNQKEYATSFGSAQTALYAYCELKGDAAKADLIAKSTTARTAQLDANKSALSADLKAPYTTVVGIGVGDPQALAICSAYR